MTAVTLFVVSAALVGAENWLLGGVVMVCALVIAVTTRR